MPSLPLPHAGPGGVRGGGAAAPGPSAARPPPPLPPYLHPKLSRSTSSSPASPPLLVATAPIPAGSCLFRELPALISDAAAGEAGLRAAFDAAVAKGGGAGRLDDALLLPPPLDSPSPPSSSSSAPHDALFARARAGAVRFGAGAGAVLAVLPTAGLWCPPSCRPSATLHLPLHYPVNARVILTAVALEDIPEGGCVTLARTDLLQEPAARRRAARGWWPSVCVGGKSGEGEGEAPTAAPDACACRACSSESDGAARAAIERMDALLQLRAAESGGRAGAASAAATGEEEETATFTAALAAQGAAGPAERAGVLAAYLSTSGLADTHWRTLAARHALVLALAMSKEYPRAWAEVGRQARAVFEILPPGHADAQRLTMDIGGEVLRAWSRANPADALEASAGGLLGGGGERGGGGGGRAGGPDPLDPGHGERQRAPAAVLGVRVRLI
jgi:hypothetical protein